MKTIELEKLQIGLNLKVSREIPDEELSNVIAYKVRGYVWSQDAGRKIEFKYPSNWWEAFKERWLRCLKVEYTVRTFEVKATYPNLNIEHHEPILRLIQRTEHIDFSAVEAERFEQHINETTDSEKLAERVKSFGTCNRSRKVYI